MHALVIDDSRAIRRVLTSFLKRLGFEVLEAENGQRALEALEGRPDARLALVDWNMPVMSGIDFIRAVRSEERFDALRIVMVTTETEMTQVATALSEGANEYVMKPFTEDVLSEKLQTLGVAA